MAKRKYTEDEMLHMLDQRVTEFGLRATARELGLSAPFVSDVLKGRRGVSSNLAKSLNFKRVLVRTHPIIWFERL